MRVIRCLLMLLLILAVVDCTTGGEDGTASESVDSQAPETLARLNGEPIHVSEFDEFLDYSGAGEASAATKKDLFRDYATRRLIRQEALKEGIVVLPAVTTFEPVNLPSNMLSRFRTGASGHKSQ